MPAYSELTRRLGFEYNGMVLHESDFESLASRREKYVAAFFANVAWRTVERRLAPGTGAA